MASIRPCYYNKWYEDAKENIQDYLKKAREPGVKATFIAGIGPHAGWMFSGKLACNIFKCLVQPCDTIVIVGGHMHHTMPAIAAFEDGYDTPFGTLDADLDLLKEVRGTLEIEEDVEPDNTVEVQLPFAKYFFPNSKALYFRAPPSDIAIKLGSTLAQSAKKLNKKVIVFGSTDLTHYGPNYGFMPKGSGKNAIKWVKEVNDKEFIDAILALKAKEAISHASKNSSACSAGAAIAALSFAQTAGAKAGTLLDYYTSYDVRADSSFVGYAGILFY